MNFEQAKLKSVILYVSLPNFPLKKEEQTQWQSTSILKILSVLNVSFKSPSVLNLMRHLLWNEYLLQKQVTQTCSSYCCNELQVWCVRTNINYLLLTQQHIYIVLTMIQVLNWLNDKCTSLNFYDDFRNLLISFKLSFWSQIK